MTFSLPDIDVGSWADYQKKELERQLSEKVQSFGLEQAINEKMAGLQEVVGGAQEAFGGAAQAVAAPAGDQMQQLQQAMAATQPTFDQPAVPVPVAEAPVAVVEQPVAQPDDRMRQLEERLRQTAPDLSQTQTPTVEPDRMRQLQDMLGQTGQAVSSQLSSMARPAPRPAAAPMEPGGDLRASARQAAAQYGLDPEIFERQIQQESGFNPNAVSRAGARGVGQFMPGTGVGVAKQLGVSPDEFWARPDLQLQGAAKHMADLKQQFGSDELALAAYNAGPGAVQKYGGVPPFEETQRYIKTIMGGVGQTAERVVGAARDQISQFGDSQLTSDEAYAACGPAAAVRFAQRFGRNPTLREATDLAKTVGWTSSQGMAGIASEQQLMQKLGIETELVSGKQIDRIAREAQTGNPVTISTRGHYFYADGYNPETGQFHVGRSGTDLRNGAEWMSVGDMERVMGPMQGALLASNPTVSASSTVQPSADTDQRIASVPSAQGESLLEQLQRASEEHTTRGRAWLDEQTRNLEQAVTQAGRDVTATNQQTPFDVAQAPLSTGAVEAVQGGALEAPGRAILQSPLTPWGAADMLSKVGTSGVGEFYKSLPTPVESVEVMTQLIEKYPRSTTGAGQVMPDLNAMTPEDRAKWAEHSMNVGASSEPVRAAGRVAEAGAGRFAREGLPALGGGIAGGVTGWETSADLPIEERIARVAGGVGIGAGAGYGAGRVLGGRPTAAAAVADVAEEVPPGVTAGVADEVVPTRPGAIPGQRPPAPETPRVESTEGLGHTNIQVGKYVPEEVRQIIQDAYDAAPEAMEAARRYVKPDEAIKEMAGELGADAQRLINIWKPGVAKNAETIYAMRQALADQSQRVVEAQQVARADPTSVDAKLKLTAAITRQRAVQEAVTGVTAEAGRAVRQFRQTVEGQSAISKYLERMAAAKGLSVDELADLMIKADLSDPAAVSKLARDMSPKTFWDKATALWYFALLSSPTTHIRNTVGNALTTATTPIETALAAVFDPVARGAIKAIKAGGETAGAEVGGRERFFGEAFADAFGAVSSIKSGLGNATRAYTKGMDPSKMSQSDLEELARMEVFTGKPGAVIHSPGRALQAEDAFSRTLNEQAAGYRMAYRQAAKENVPWDKTIDRITEIMRNPDKDFLDEMVKQGTYRTFQNDTGLSEWLVRGRAQMPALRFLLPFVRTPINILRYGLERSPLALGKIGSEFMTKGGRKGLAERGAGDLADRMGRMTMGSVIMGGLTLWGKDNLTGRAPSDPAERDAFYRQGKQPYSFKGPDGKWWSYQALQPYTSVFATAAELSESMAEGSLKDPNNIPGLAATAAATVGISMLDMPWTQGLADAIDLVTNNGPDADNIEKKLGEWSERQAAGLVPGAMRQLARANDNIVRDPQNQLQAMLANIPGTQGLAEKYPEQLGALGVPERLDVFGQGRERPTEGWESVLSPFNRSEPTDDPVELALQRLEIRDFDVQPGFVGKKVTAFGQPVELTDPQERFYQTTAGQLTYAALQLLVGTQEWDAMPDAEKVKTVDTVSSRIREAVRDQMEPGLLNQALNEVMETQRRRGPEPTSTAPTPMPQPTQVSGGMREPRIREAPLIREP